MNSDQCLENVKREKKKSSYFSTSRANNVKKETKRTKKMQTKSTNSIRKLKSMGKQKISDSCMKMDGDFDPFDYLSSIEFRDVEETKSNDKMITSHHELQNGSISLISEQDCVTLKPLVIHVTKVDEDSGELKVVKENDLDAETSITAEIVEDSNDIDSLPTDLSYELKSKCFRCKLCCVVFSVFSEAETHLKLVHASAVTDECLRSKRTGEYCCPNCDRSFISALGRDNHNVRMHLKNRIVDCPKCSKRCSSFRTLETHLRTEHEVTSTVQCNLCDMEFVLQSSLEHHKKISHLSKNSKLTSSNISRQYTRYIIFKCPQCKKEFDTYKSLRNHHLKDHKGEQLYCHLCNLKIARLTTLERHLAEVHKVGNINCYTCTVCRISFPLAHNLEDHYIEDHDKQLNYLCYFCGKKFACMEMFRFHKKSHEAFKCQFCSLGFKKEEKLEEHLRTVHKKDFSVHIKRFIKEEEVDDQTKEVCAIENEPNSFSKVLEVNLDGSVFVDQEDTSTVVVKDTSIVNSTGADFKDLFKGVKLKDLPKKMSCPICSKELTTKFLKTHLRSHNGRLPYKCNVCDKAYAQGTLLRKHMKNRHHEEFLKLDNKYPQKKPMQCEYCDKSFDDIMILETHLWEHMDVKNYQCKTCDIKFGMQKNLFLHYKSHYFRDEKECSVCGKSFKSVGFYGEHMSKCLSNWLCEECNIHCHSETAYAKHKKLMHDNSSNKYKCEVCNKQCLTKCNYESHMITHSKESLYPCSYCHKSFRRARPLKYHIAKEHKTACFTCNYCGIATNSQFDLQVHKKEHRKEIQCEFCTSVYLSRQSLDNHIKVYHSSIFDKESVVCSYCSEMFEKQIDLKNHLLTHFTELMFICHVNECHKVFKKEAVLRSHMSRLHPHLEYFCHFCYKKCILDSDLQSHIATHMAVADDEDVLKCLRCRFTTTSKVDLQDHITSHSEEPQFECNLCGVKLQQKCAILKHVETVHQISDNAGTYVIMSNWKCNVCEKVFMSYATTIKHLRQHAFHGVQAEGTLQKTPLVQPLPTPSFWDAILPSMKVQVKTEQNNKTILMEYWQCPSCFNMTDSQESIRKHILGSSKCQDTLLQNKQEDSTTEGNLNLIFIDNNGLKNDNEIDFFNNFMTDEENNEGFLLQMNNGEIAVPELSPTSVSLIQLPMESTKEDHKSNLEQYLNN